MKEFQPNYENMISVALNKNVKRFPLYDHKIDTSVMEKILNKKFADLYFGDKADINEFFRIYCNFFKNMGYDTVSFEELIGPSMPDSGALGEHKPGAIHNRDDYNKYPWNSICDNYFRLYSKSFEALRNNLPEGMKVIGGAGYGIFECVQDIVSYEHLCYMMVDDPILYKEIFIKIGQINLAIWKKLLDEFGDIFAVCRFGDDLGFKSGLLISDDDIRENIIPQYKIIIDEVHKKGKPFLLHSCGKIFDVMDDLIENAKIDSKHSNEDQIAPFEFWVEKYGDKLGNFGGIDTNAVIQLDEKEMTEYINRVVTFSSNRGGFAFGSGNSIPDYVPYDKYLLMNHIARQIRGDFD